MQVIFRIGLLAIWLIGVTAEFEYSVGNLNALLFPSGEIPQKGDGNLRLVNENVRVLHERKIEDFDFPDEMAFRVKEKYFNSKINNPNQKRTPDCNGLPGLFLTPRPERVKAAGCIPTSSTYSPPTQVCCYTGVTFGANEDSNKNPGIEVTARFHCPKIEDYLIIIIPIFTPPIEQADEEHAKEHRVLRDLFPIPPHNAAWEGLKPRGKYGDEFQYFVSDISWLKTVIPRAIRLKGKSEWYYPGPVIINEILYTKTYGLDYNFWKRFVKKSPVISSGSTS